MDITLWKADMVVECESETDLIPGPEDDESHTVTFRLKYYTLSLDMRTYFRQLQAKFKIENLGKFAAALLKRFNGSKSGML